MPIVKFTDRKTAVKVDVSFNVQTGISSADFIKVASDSIFVHLTEGEWERALLSCLFMYIIWSVPKGKA